MSKKRKNKNPENNFVVREIDYDKLAAAIIKAHDKIEKNKKQEEVKEQEQARRNWREVTGITAKNKALKILQTLWFMILFPFVPKKKFVNDYATSALLIEATRMILGVFQLLFLAITAFSLVATLNVFNFKEWQWNNLLFISTLLISWIFYGLLRMSRAEISNMNDKQLLMAIFSSVTSFVAMILALVALFV